MPACAHTECDTATEQQEGKKENWPLKQEFSRHTHLLNWEPALYSSTWKNSWWWDDLLWICEVKASMENKIWLLLPGLRLIPLIHWHDLTGTGVKSLPWLMQCATAAYLPPSLLSSEITCSSTQHQAITPSGMTHLCSPWCQWSGSGNSALLGRIWAFSCRKISDWTGGWHCPELKKSNVLAIKSYIRTYI